MKTERRSADVLLSAAMALVFGLIFYTFNTPLGPSIGSDNAMYLTLGTALAKGYAPYTQIFDHKGPMLYLLQMLPQLLSGGYSTLAVFIQQVIALFLCLRVVSRIARTLGAYSGVTQLFYLALIGSLVGGGNLTEEYASLPTLLGAYAALRVFLRPDWTRRLFAPALLMGACTMAAFLLRANNALPLAALTLALALCLLAKKQFAPLGQCAAGFAACDNGSGNSTGSGNAGAQHEHTWSENYSYNDSKHYKICSGCNEKSEEGEHTYGSDGYTCTVCGYENEAKKPAQKQNAAD